MNYKNNYNLLINKAQARYDFNQHFKLNIDYTDYEHHHIIPVSLGGEYENNMVYLTPREHFIAHYLLMKITNTEEMKKAFDFMSSGRGIIGYSSRRYEKKRKYNKEKAKLIHSKRDKSFSLVIYRYFNNIAKTEKQLINIELIFRILLHYYCYEEKSLIRRTGLEEYNMLLNKGFLQITSGKRISHDGGKICWHNEVIINEKFREILKKIINKTNKEEYIKEYF
jgi:hypothetical protein